VSLVFRECADVLLFGGDQDVRGDAHRPVVFPERRHGTELDLVVERLPIVVVQVSGREEVTLPSNRPGPEEAPTLPRSHRR
jgi:hypothetical protein